MGNIIKHLTSVSLDSRSGSPPGGRLLALTLVVMLAFGSTFPGVALAGEADSEGEGTAPPVEVPVDPGLDPGGEEEVLEEAPAVGGDEETGAVEVEPEVDLEAPPVDEVSSAVNQAPDESAPSTPTASPEPAAAAPEPEPEPVQQKAPEAKTSEPVANQSIVGPKPKRAERQAAASEDSTSGEAALVGESPPEEAPATPAPQPAAPPPADHGRHIAGKKTYVVKEGDCLWHIAARVLPADADTGAIESKIEWLYETNESRIGTGDPNLIYPGTELIVR